MDFLFLSIRNLKSNISAYLNDELTAKYPGSNYFWSMPFEVLDYKSQEKMFNHLIETIILLLNHDTRIIQVNGILDWNFTCEYHCALITHQTRFPK